MQVTKRRKEDVKLLGEQDVNTCKRSIQNAISDLKGAYHLGYWSDVYYVIEKLEGLYRYVNERGKIAGSDESDTGSERVRAEEAG